MTLYDDYAPRSAGAAKWLHPDGSVTGAGAEQLSGPDVSRAADFATRSPQAAKWLLPDGTITDTLPAGSGGGTGGATEPPATIEVYLPIAATDALDNAALISDYSIAQRDIEMDRTCTTPNATDGAEASIT
jgi:hypothetical protein